MGIRSTILHVLLMCLVFFPRHIDAQPIPNTHRPAIILFLPLHLDSIYDAKGQYTLKQYEFPRYVSAPLEFYQGFSEALDSLKLHPGNLDVYVFDTRSEQVPLTALLQKDTIKKATGWLLFGNVSESREIADAAKIHQVPLININLPNDGGVQDNPFYFLWNNTLETQCEGIYRHWQQYYPLEEIVIVRKKGSMEDRILNHIKAVEKNTRGIPIQYKLYEAEDTISVEAVSILLDSTKQTILFGASLDERFARNAAAAVATLVQRGYKVELMGMSTWDNVREFTTNRFRNVEIIIPTPFYYPRTDEWSNRLQTRFLENNYSKPSDTYLRGYEMAWMLHSLLQKNMPLAEQLPGPKKLLFGEIHWQPEIDRNSMQLNYFENKKIYFVKRMEGAVLSVR